MRAHHLTLRGSCLTGVLSVPALGYCIIERASWQPAGSAEPRVTFRSFFSPHVPKWLQGAGSPPWTAGSLRGPPPSPVCC
ncbi:unnamed protein product [Rangifer tarandus platyrhynchus]|uniref:Secreted protein n=1 Tax=Rangifer tarandus platyrhynchus TaxID=3082113 RepID=A0ABN8YS99_RANTA|nr:unnamed protein product [Rangifer tarandus platyrhynchus]